MTSSVVAWAFRAVDVAVHRLDAQGLVADEGVGVDLGAFSDRVGVVAEAVEGPPALVAHQVERRRRPLGQA